MVHDDVIKWKHFPRNWPFVRGFTGPGEFPTQKPVTRSFDVFFDLRLKNGWVNNRKAGDSSRHRGHYDVIVMLSLNPSFSPQPICCFDTIFVNFADFKKSQGLNAPANHYKISPAHTNRHIIQHATLQSDIIGFNTCSCCINIPDTFE